MNPFCGFCDKPAVMVCKHPDCNEPPLICNGPCNNRVGIRLHTHNGEKDLITYDKFLKKVDQINEARSFDDFYRDHLRAVEKKSIITLEHLKKIMEKMIRSHKSDLKKEFSLKLKKDAELALDKVETKAKFVQLTGRQINYLMVGKDIYVNQTMIQATVETMKSQILKDFDDLNQTILGQYIPYNKRVKSSHKLYSEGNQLKTQSKWEEALQKFRQALILNEFDYNVSFQIGYCLNKLKRYKEAEQSYLKVIKLKPDYSDCLNNIGLTYFRREMYEDAIRYYTAAIKYNSKYPLYYMNRAQCYLKCNKLKEANFDYMELMTTMPSQNVTNQLAIIAQKMKEQVQVSKVSNNK